MGNKEYPVLNEFECYLNSHSGYVNAHTMAEHVTYEANVPNAYLDGCLVRFAACFKEPLFRPEHIESEINPVNNEFVDAFMDDEIRFHQLLASLVKKGHPASQFFYGNYKSLLEGRDVNEVRNRMAAFFEQHYKASRMSLVVQSQESLDAVEKLVRSYFSNLPTAPNNDPTPEQLNEAELIRDLLSNTNVFAKPDYPFVKETMNHLYVVEPIEDANTLKLIYCFPPLVHLHKLKPLHTLASILGYEGTNSLIRYLIKKKLVLEFLVGADESCDVETSKYHSLLSLIIKLTDEGLEKVDYVVRLINYYIGLMVREGPQERHFDEERLISLINIRFEDEPAPMKNTQEIAQQLFRYPLEYAIVGPKLLSEFNPVLVKYCLEFLKNQPRLSFLESKRAFANSSWPAQAEPWSDLQYKVQPLPESWSEPLIEDAELVANLKMPPPNDFVPSNFELRPQECFLEYPVLIEEAGHYRCYFKNDKQFKMPKACVYLIWQSDYLRLNPEALVSLHLYVKYFILTISEHTYPAEMAGLHYSIHASKHGLELKVDGFNDKLAQLIRLIVDSLAALEINSTLFDAVKQELIREYYNLLINNEEQVPDLLDYLQAKNHLPYMQQREIVKHLDIETIKKHLALFFGTSYLQGLVQGNYTKQEAQELFFYVRVLFEVIEEAVAVEEIKKCHVHRLPAGENYCYVKSFNKQDENVLTINNYQLGVLSEEEIVMLDLCMQEMSDPLFNLLRNEKTLAYYLYNRHTRSRNDVCSFQIFIKSLANKFTPFYVDEQIEWFIGHFLKENIVKMTEAHFEEMREARIKLKQVPFVSLRKEADYNWKEIWCHSYKFDRRKTDIEILKKVSLFPGDFLLFCTSLNWNSNLNLIHKLIPNNFFIQFFNKKIVCSFSSAHS